jgi:hypothetical protein
MGTHAQALVHARPAAAPVLTGVRWRDREHLTASVCCFAVKDTAELRPARITDALGQEMVPQQVRDLHIFEVTSPPAEAGSF